MTDETLKMKKLVFIHPFNRLALMCHQHDPHVSGTPALSVHVLTALKTFKVLNELFSIQKNPPRPQHSATRICAVKVSQNNLQLSLFWTPACVGDVTSQRCLYVDNRAESAADPIMVPSSQERRPWPGGLCLICFPLWCFTFPLKTPIFQLKRRREIRENISVSCLIHVQREMKCWRCICVSETINKKQITLKLYNLGLPQCKLCQSGSIKQVLFLYD